MHRTSRCLTCRCAEKEVTVRALRLLSRCHSFFWSILVTHVVIHSAAQFNTVTQSPVKQLLLNSSKTVTQVLIFLANNPSWNFKVPSHNNAFNHLWWQFEPTMLNANPQSKPTMLNHCNDKWCPDNSPIDSPVPKTMVSWTECKQQLHKRNAHNLLKLVAPFQNV